MKFLRGITSMFLIHFLLYNFFLKTITVNCDICIFLSQTMKFIVYIKEIKQKILYLSYIPYLLYVSIFFVIRLVIRFTGSGSGNPGIFSDKMFFVY